MGKARGAQTQRRIGPARPDPVPPKMVNLQLGHNPEEQLVMMSFAADISMITFTPYQAQELAKGLLDHAAAALGKKAS